MAKPIKRGTVVPQKVKSVSAFLSYVEREKRNEEACGNKADFIFRGQPIDKPLLPKLARPPLHHDHENREHLVLEEFKRTSLGLTDLTPESDWDFLALAQHHGLPTRLLDWTYGALATVWFAVENEGKDHQGKPQNAVVWLLKTQNVDFINIGSQQDISPLDNRKTRIYRPRAVTRRIVAQGGLFTVHMFQKAKKNFLPLEENSRYTDRLVKFSIEARSCEKLKTELSGCGVNRASLFPDLDGLCSHLAWRYSK